jgi:DNA-binding MarR family transcriptional regulator
MAMPGATVNHPRVEGVLRRIARIGTDPAVREAVALGLVDSVLEGDDETLAAALDALRDALARADEDQELAGWLDAAVAFALWGLERVPSRDAVRPGTQAHDFLRMLDASPQLPSAELRRRLEIDETQVSRTGRRLLERGLVSRRKAGREVFWQLSPRGKRALEDAPPTSGRSPDADFWQEALRRGFEAASGDQPGEPREVDPTRERIIACTLELHQSRGIQATTWDEIADKAGVPLDTMGALFRTQDDLVRSCGAHFLETLELPPADRAPDVFAGAASDRERVRRLVDICFGAYERGADGMRAARRERTVPAVEGSVAALETTFDALVDEALRPLGADGPSIAALRALTDLEVWGILRDQGATPAAAVDLASTAVERWLAARPAR